MSTLSLEVALSLNTFLRAQSILSRTPVPMSFILSVCCLKTCQPSLFISLWVYLLLKKFKYLPVCFQSYTCLLADLEFPRALLSWIWCGFWLRLVKDLHSSERAHKRSRKQADTAAFRINHNLQLVLSSNPHL